MASRTPLYIVCSPRPRVGTTLIARLLVEFFHADLRSVAAFDLNPNNPALADYLPGWTEVADVTDTRGQMAIFDTLIIDDGTPKVVDLGPESFQGFFTTMQEIAFVEGARQEAIEPILLYVVNTDGLSTRTYASLHERFPSLILVPVYNEAVTKGYDYPEKFPSAGPAAAPLRVPELSPLLKGVIDKPSFSFASFLQSQEGTATEIHDWIRLVFREFREFELRLLLNKLRSSL